jgi:hypothetical protein
LLCSDGQAKREISYAMQVDGGHHVVESRLGNAEGIFSGCQIGRKKFAGFIGNKLQRLRQTATGDLDARGRDDCTGRVSDRTRYCVSA